MQGPVAGTASWRRWRSWTVTWSWGSGGAGAPRWPGGSQGGGGRDVVMGLVLEMVREMNREGTPVV